MSESYNYYKMILGKILNINIDYKNINYIDIYNKIIHVNDKLNEIKNEIKNDRNISEKEKYLIYLNMFVNLWIIYCNLSFNIIMNLNEKEVSKYFSTSINDYLNLNINSNYSSNIKKIINSIYSYINKKEYIDKNLYDDIINNTHYITIVKENINGEKYYFTNFFHIVPNALKDKNVNTFVDINFDIFDNIDDYIKEYTNYDNKIEKDYIKLKFKNKIDLFNTMIILCSIIRNLIDNCIRLPSFNKIDIISNKNQKKIIIKNCK